MLNFWKMKFYEFFLKIGKINGRFGNFEIYGAWWNSWKEEELK